MGTKTMFTVDGVKFDSFMAAMRSAQKTGSEVYEVSTGLRRWAPAPKVSANRMRRYENQKAAYEAQQRLN